VIFGDREDLLWKAFDVEGTRFAVFVGDAALQQMAAKHRENVLCYELAEGADGPTAKAAAKAAFVNYLAAHSTLKVASGQPYFNGLDDFESRTNDPVRSEACVAVAELLAYHEAED
jgi:hypothetical protein